MGKWDMWEVGVRGGWEGGVCVGERRVVENLQQ